MLGGYTGKVLRIDLTEEVFTVQTFSEETLRKYIGGSGLGAKILFEETSEKTDPLGPENLLIFMTGPLVGTQAPNFGRYEVVTKSPLTGAYGEGNSGGSWGTKLKHSGYDGIIVKGKAKKPVYVHINNGEVEIKDASHIWGRDTYETDSILKGELGNRITTCSIGPAGENLVRIASIMNDGKEGRAIGRCGVGAVMGSKNLKAIAVQGSIRPHISEEEKFKESVKYWAPQIKKNTEGFLGKYGTACGMSTVEAVGDLPIKNWSEGSFPAHENISGQAISASILVKQYHCAQCAIGCGRSVKVSEGPYAGVDGGGPEYETLGMFGANCMVDNLEAIAKANEICNRYGLDTISTGSCVAFAMEAYERGLITKEQAGGLEIKWGDPDVLVNMVEKIGKRQDIGYILGEGTRIASRMIGGTAPEFAVHVRGLEFPAHDPRAANSSGLQYAVSPRGACHLSSFTHDFEFGATFVEMGITGPIDRFAVKGKAEFVSRFQDLNAMFDSLTGCKFVIYGLCEESIKTIISWLNMVTGWDVTQEEFFETGARIMNLKRMYNVMCGQSRKDDILPPRALSHKRGSGGAAENLPHLGEMLSEYYEIRGWDEFGIPKEETLRKLGLA